MTEAWRDIPGYEGRYQASDLGRVRGRRGVLAQAPTTKGYLQVTLYSPGRKRSVLVHRAVALAFVPNPEGKPQINHKDTDKTNNRPGNLAWTTNLENQQHGAEHGLMPKKLANGNGKLSEDDVRRIKLHLSTGAPPKAIAEAFEVSADLVRLIRRGLRHAA